MSTVNTLGERKAIKLIIDRLERDPEELLGLGLDDAVAKETAGGQVLVAHTDMFAAGTDMPPGMSYRQAARKVVVANVSDLAAKGAKPLGLLFSWGLPSNLQEEAILDLAVGLNMGAREYETYVLGGDLGETTELTIAGTALGLTMKDRLIKRTGARPGDVLAVTGPMGLTAVGFKIILFGFEAPDEAVRVNVLNAVYMPRARLREGLALADVGAVSGGMDISDGLAVSLHQFSEASGVGMVVTDVPLSSQVLSFSEHHGLDPMNLALYEGGEEFELLLAVKPEKWREALEAVKRAGGDLHRIGYVTGRKGVLLKQPDGVFEEVEAKGWEHFRRFRK